MVSQKIVIGLVAVVVLIGAGIFLSMPMQSQTVAPAAPAPGPQAPAAPAPQPGPAPPAAYEAPPSGLVRAYGSVDAEDMKPIIKAFQEKYPFVAVDYIRGSPAEVFTRVTTELKATGKSADAVLVSFPGTLQLLQQNVFTPYVSPNAATFPDSLKDKDGMWTAVVLLGQTITYNKNLVPASELPKSLADLTNPKWKGKITMHDYTLGTTSTQIWASLAEKIGKDKVTKFLADMEANGVRRTASTGAQADEVSRGEFAIGIVAQVHDVVRLKLAGAPIEILQLSDFPIMVAPSAVSLMKTAENPRAAKLFIDYLLTDDAQKVIGNIEVRFPAKPGVDSKFNLDKSLPAGIQKFNYPTPTVFTTINQWTTEFKAIVAAKR